MFYAPDWSFPAPENAENRQFQVSIYISNMSKCFQPLIGVFRRRKTPEIGRFRRRKTPISARDPLWFVSVILTL